MTSRSAGTPGRAKGAGQPAQPVAVVGSGPGNPDLLTVRAAELLAAADVVLVAEGVPAPALSVAGRAVAGGAVLVGPGEVADPVKEAVTRSRAGERVVRVLPGDPFEHPDLGREVAALQRAKVTVEVVPALGAPATAAYAGVAVGLPHTVVALDPTTPTAPDWAALAAAPGNLVLLLPVAAELGKAAASLLEHGRRADTPVSLTVDGTTSRQRTVVSTLDAVERDAAALLGARDETPVLPGGPAPDVVPAVAVVGPAVRSRDKLAWWESRALFGWTVLVPRTREQAGSLAAMLAAQGAVPLEVPTIAVEPPRTPASMDRAINGLVSGRYQWIAFTSTNAVRAVREKLEEYGLDARAFAGVKVAAVGEVTAAAVRAWGMEPDLVPSGQQSSEGLLADWPPYDSVLDPINRVFLPRADIATETLVAGLKERGWEVDDVTAYRTVRASPPPAPVREALKGGRVDAVLFTSSSTVRNLVGIAGKPHEATVIAVIGPQTAATAVELGLRVDVESTEPNVPALVEALAGFALARRTEQQAVPSAARPRSARSRSSTSRS
ncbi:MAG: uroporphyrinogen methyltransferase / synthase [Frankiaceae bacterium]|nr:uroporphyrinogen methyltransferase / synthase [Frankiaceae bacterium]